MIKSYLLSLRIVGVFLILLASCNRQLPEGKGEIHGSVLADSGKPVVGFELQLNFRSGNTKTVITDSLGTYMFRLPRARYRLYGLVFGKKGAKGGVVKNPEEIIDNIAVGFPVDSTTRDVLYDLETKSKIEVPPFYITRPIVVSEPADKSIITSGSNDYFCWRRVPGAYGYKVLVGREMKEIKEGVRYLVMEESNEKDNTYIVPIDTEFSVLDTCIQSPIIIQGLKRPNGLKQYYHWRVNAYDSTGYCMSSSGRSRTFLLNLPSPSKGKRGG
jgi:hypothetical protein